MKHRHIAAYLRLTTCGALLATCAGCSDYLETEDLSGVDAETFFATGDGLTSLEATAYNAMKAVATNSDMEEWGTDLYIPTRQEDKAGEPLYKWTLTADNGTVKEYYTSCYNVANQANCLLKYSEQQEDARRGAVAKWLRAYAYWKLAQHFGAVPYIDHYVSDAGRAYPKTPLAELYGVLVADLQACLEVEDLPDQDRKGQVSKQAVNALLAKLCLEAAYDLNNADYAAKAEQYATDAIAGTQLTMSFEDKWSYKNEHNEEVIFALQYARSGYPGKSTEGGNDLQFRYSGYYVGSQTEGIKYGNSMMCPSVKGLYLWDQGDQRWDATFMTTVFNSIKSQLPWPAGALPTQGYFAYYNPAVDKTAAPIALRFFASYYDATSAKQELTDHQAQYADHSGDTDEATRTANKTAAYILGSKVTPYSFGADGTATAGAEMSHAEAMNGTQRCMSVKKFDDPLCDPVDGSLQSAYREVVVFHVSDLYLTRAEARLRAGDEAGALADVNAVRKRAAATELASFAAYAPRYKSFVGSALNIEPLDCILDERARELWAERSRWTDLRRTGRLKNYNEAYNVNLKGDVRTYLPIPAGAITSNEALSDADQNPGY